MSRPGLAICEVQIGCRRRLNANNAILPERAQRLNSVRQATLNLRWLLHAVDAVDTVERAITAIINLHT